METEQLDDISGKILDAASKRFLHYGYGKTTMSEIAEDCNMSTGNLYRYFSSKLDIAEMFVHALRRKQLDRLRAVSEREDLGPAGKLREFFLLKLKITYERFHNKPKAYELSNELMETRPEIAKSWESAEIDILSAILSSGISAGAFTTEDTKKTAKILIDSAYRFASPVVFHDGEFAQLREELNGVIDFILDGFRWRTSRVKT